MRNESFPRPLFLLLVFFLALLPLAAFPALASVSRPPSSVSRPPSSVPHTTISVTTPDDELNADGDCSLREAVQAANTDTPIDTCAAGSGPDIISVPAGVYSFTLPTAGEDANQDGDLDIADSVVINGAGADVTILNGNGMDRLFHVTSSSSIVEITDLTMTNGVAAPGSGNGGGIMNSGDLTLAWVEISYNSAPRAGGIATDATGLLMIQNSSIHHNTAPYTGSGTGVAGAIEHFGPSMTVINSTFSDNTSGYFNPTGNLRDSNPAGNTSVAFSTISDNTQGGLFTSGGNFTVENSIIANNSGQNCNAGTFTSGDYNLVSNAECGLGAANDLTNTDPLLEPLQYVGGPTQSRALQAGSPALDRIPNVVNGCGTTYGIDQRGFIRPLNGLCDTGAVEGTISVGNLPPVAIGNTYVITEDWNISVGAPGLLAGDSDPDLDPISVTHITTPTNGDIFFFEPDGSFGYWPDANFNGVDTFEYTISDGALTDTAVVTMTVIAVEDAPVMGGDWYTTSQDIPLSVSAPGVLVNDYDPEGITLTVELLSLPTNGSASLLFDGALFYTPTLGYTGQDTFTYMATDGTLTNTATVTVTILPGGAGVDLTVPTLIASPNDVCRGQFFALIFAVSNQGSLDAGAHQLFLYNDATPDGFTNQVFTANLSGVLAGQTRYFSLSASSFLTGTRYLKAWVDGAGVITETNEGNNTAGIPLTVQPDPAPTGSLLINGGTSTAVLPNLTLTLDAADTGNCATSVAEMRFAYDGLTTPWEPYTTTKNIIVLGSGEVRVAVQLKDEHNNVSTWFEATITLGITEKIYLPVIRR